MRYDQILKLIDLFKPRVIVEIGTWNGENAIRMIKTAQKHRTHIEYYGYDLFEEATAETDQTEFNVKPHNHEHKVRAKILENCPNTFVSLIKGNTRETLKQTPPHGDFCYIDGGHSLETIASDYHYSSHIPIIVFDDYYIPDDKGVCPDLSLVGCNRLVSGLTGCAVLPDADPIKGGGLTQLVVRV